MASWDRSVDFVVVGTGAAGLTAAVRAHDLGARVLVLEKASFFGGNSAISGGVVWVPNNPSMRAAGIEDSEEDALSYLEAITAGSADKEKLRAYVDTAPRMMRYLEDRACTRFDCLPHYPDYYPELAGGRAGGRSCEPALFDSLEIREHLSKLRKISKKRLALGGRITIRATEARDLLEGGWPMLRFTLRGLLSYYLDFRARRARLSRARQLSLGSALVASLWRALMERGVPVWLESPVLELVVEGACVTGVVVSRKGDGPESAELLRIEAHRGVLLASGGFERNRALREQHQPLPTSDAWTAGCESNTGDAVALAQAAGAEFDLMDEAWWCPTMRVEGEEEDPVHIVIFENHLPHSLIVDSCGRRFMNEAAPYNDIGKSIYRAHSEEASTIPAYLLFDARYRRRYPCGPMTPGYAMPDWMLPRGLHGPFFERAATLEKLAGLLGIDAEGLKATVRRFNRHAAAGCDPDFARGESLQDRYYSVARDLANPNLGALDKPPFYGVRIYPGDLGTKGGPRTDVHARVLAAGNRPIDGLYAAGNCSAVVMGKTYPGAGGTIGPAMAFGFRAAEHACAAAASSAIDG